MAVFDRRGDPCIKKMTDGFTAAGKGSLPCFSLEFLQFYAISLAK
jgi:hypothetical protein